MTVVPPRASDGRSREDSLATMRRIGQVVSAVFLLLGVFWAGRESDHGLTAFWEHWWCPIPLALILLGLAIVLVTRRPSPSA
jgi:protein-S-isoprenylcysteine O-methyltransferase Ste14